MARWGVALVLMLTACKVGGGTDDMGEGSADAGSREPADAAPGQADASTPDAAPSPDAEVFDPPPFEPVYRIAVRMHIGDSGRPAEDFEAIFAEMNDIWWSQAGLCFEFTAVDHDTLMSTGFDFFWAPSVGGANGYYAGDHDIWTKDFPGLGSAPNPVEYPAARTAAHELGHGLNLSHRQDSDDNLMRSGTKGWQLNSAEISTARNRAEQKALDDTTPLRCGDPVFE